MTTNTHQLVGILDVSIVERRRTRQMSDVTCAIKWHFLPQVLAPQDTMVLIYDCYGDTQFAEWREEHDAFQNPAGDIILYEVIAWAFIPNPNWGGAL